MEQWEKWGSKQHHTKGHGGQNGKHIYKKHERISNSDKKL